MQYFNVKNPPFQVYGIPHFEERKSFHRLPEDLRNAVPTLIQLGKRSTGARIGFRTNSRHIGMRITCEPLTAGTNMSLLSDDSCFIFIGDHQTSRYAEAIKPEEYGLTEFEKTISKHNNEMEEVLVILTRGAVLKSVEVALDEGAELLPPTPYQRGPVVFYGSSIVENSCPASGFNSYPQMCSRFLDCDYYNFGFSGNARGELPIADYILTLPMKAFVLDYDYNAPDPDFLQKTHEPFFLRIREARPDLPILMMSKPNFDYDIKGNSLRREIIRKTYENALARGDKHVWFLDGETFFGDADRELCTVDRIHPNDLGFYRMAKVVAPVLQKMLDGNTNET